MCPGECIIWDRGGEFCNKVVKRLADAFGVQIRVIRAGRPMANGQAESAVKNVKNKLRLLCLENSNTSIDTNLSKMSKRFFNLIQSKISNSGKQLIKY